MPTIARTAAVGWAHHLTQRGNNRQAVFFVDDDRRVHLVAVPQHEKALAQAAGRTLPGRPLGSDTVLSERETLLGRRVRP